MPISYAPRQRKTIRWASIAAGARVRGGVSAPVKEPRAKNKTEEHDAQAALFEEHIVPRLHPDAVAFAIGNGGKRHPKVAKAMKREGVVAGVPDIYAIRLGQSFFLEMKKPKGGRVSPEQKIMMARLVRAGAQCAVAAGLEAAIAQLEAWCLLRPAEGRLVAAEEMAA